jgi:DnaB-like helicase C terminal domain
MAVKFGGGGVQDEPRMTPAELEDLLVHIIRVPAVYSEARIHIQSDDWDPHSERHYRILIDGLFKLGDSKLYPINDIPYVAVYSEVRGVMDDDPMLRDAQFMINDIIGRPIDVDPYNGLLYHAYKNVDEDELSMPYGIMLLQKFLRERQVIDKVRRVLDGAGGRNVTGFGLYLSNITLKARAVEAIGSNPFKVMLPENWVPTTIETTPIGITWADELMGGQAPGDVNGILGPFGGGKTMFAIQAAVERAKLCMAWHIAGDVGHERLKQVIFASYEEDVDRDIRPRVMSCAALIKKGTLENLRSLDELSRKGNLHPYEVAMYIAQKVTDPDLKDGEYERLMKAHAQVGQNLQMMDMRGNGRGSGWIPELASYIERQQQQNDWAIDTIIIDYTKIMCRRHLKAKDKDPDRHLRHLINETPMTAKMDLAERFGCTVWLLQQLSGEANTRSPTAQLSHAHAGEARDFAENLVSCLVFGVKDGTSGCCRVFYTKGRRSENQGLDTLVMLDGSFGRTVSAAGNYKVVPGKIVQAHLYDEIHGDSTNGNAAGPPISTWDPYKGTEGDE